MNIENPTYSIISFKGSELPEKYTSLIFSRWLRSLRYGNTLFKRITPNDYYKTYHQFIENLLKKPGCIIRLAVLSDDHDVVLGFSVSREDVLDYVHVQADYRKIGIAKKLIPEGVTTFSHITTTALNIWQPKYKHIKFNPFA
jgi:GNAT superfamily N-acetyltransferase